MAGFVALILMLLAANSLQGAEPVQRILILSVEGTVELSRGGAAWQPARTNQFLIGGDQIRVGPRSRAALQLKDRTILPMGERSALSVGESKSGPQILQLLRGVFYFFHRDDPADFRFNTPTVAAVVRGTEFEVEIDESGETKVALFDGKVSLENDQGALELNSGEGAIVKVGAAPERVAALFSFKSVQWVLYYPIVFDASELAETPSVAAYKAGNIKKALALLSPADTNENYVAGLLLSIGAVEEAEKTSSKYSELIAAVTGDRPIAGGDVKDATDAMIQSYVAQASGDLGKAREMAVRATGISPKFGSAWARLAEIEFSFANYSQADKAIETAVALEPENAYGRSLRGYLLTAKGRFDAALNAFETAIALDPALPHAWQGRGLVRIRKGDLIGGRTDLEVAATREPNRSLYRSYLAKAFFATGNLDLARVEIALAIKLDGKDPTPWLYSALFNQSENRINEAIGDLETSVALNDNRRVFRSRALLDQDRATRSANLAKLYSDAGMTEVGLKEALLAVNEDPSNYSAHLFLANSYHALRDFGQVNLRYEAPWLSEYLLANLLAPAAAGAFSPTLAQNEYTRMFEQNRFGMASDTIYRSAGDWSQTASQYGIFNNSSYVLDVSYQNWNGQRVNADLEQTTLSLRAKYDLTLKDTVYVQGIYYNSDRGDLAQYRDPASANPNYRIRETQEPIALLGYHRAWSPSSHTLFLAGRLQDTATLTDPDFGVVLLRANGSGNVIRIARDFPKAPLSYRSDLDGYTAEAQHIIGSHNQNIIGGVRFQSINLDASNQLGASSPTRFGDMTTTPAAVFSSGATSDSIDSRLTRISSYLYYTFTPIERLHLSGGVAYDYVEEPRNFRRPPVTQWDRDHDQLSPKIGATYSADWGTDFRLAYSRSLSATTFENSFSLEPTSIGGLNQRYRSVIPESAAGSLSAAPIDFVGAGVSHRFPSRTYVEVEANCFSSDAEEAAGAILLVGVPPSQVTSSIRQLFNYTEHSARVAVFQMVGRDWTFGARYVYSESSLRARWPEIPATVSAVSDFSQSSTLHTAQLSTHWNHPIGLFAIADGSLLAQEDEDFWDLNVQVGYRFLRRRAEVSVGALNLIGRDYRFNPLNITPDLPRERLFVTRFRFYF